MWRVFGRYELGGEPGSRYLFSPETRPTRAFDPLAREHAGLFLEFARWFDAHRMENAKPSLDTERNARAAMAWVDKYGVLGLARREHHAYVSGGTASIAATRLNAGPLPPSVVFEGDPRGGEGESVAAFALEAHEASIALKLFEAATAEPVDREAIDRYITPRHERPDTDETARRWALTTVRSAVDRKLRRGAYPILTGEPGAWVEEWGFESLLAAMWLQMRYFMSSVESSARCEECGQTFPKTRQDRRYCSKTCASRARARRNYHEGGGRSSKEVRRQRRMGLHS